MARPRKWKCQRVTKGVKCGAQNPSRLRVCAKCGKRRPPKRKPDHMRVLGEMPYEEWVARFGEVCGICGRPPSVRRRLDRDHCHSSGSPRGLLCARCNRSLPSWVTPEWLEGAAEYLRRAA